MEMNTKPTYPATPDTTIKAGDYVRCYDFPGVATHYIVGRVVDIDRVNQSYVIKQSHSVNGETCVIAEHTRLAPLNGLESFNGLTRGVQRIPEPFQDTVTVIIG